jgi:F0F1-type ATP synthase assembly protein I
MAVPTPPPPEFPPIPPRPDRDKPKHDLSPIGQAYGMAFEFGVYLIVCAGMGWLADQYVVGSGKTWTVVGAGFGLVGGAVRLIRSTRKLYREMDKPGS